MIFNFLKNKIVKSILFYLTIKTYYYKGLKKQDLLICDDIFPNPISGFRLEEFTQILKEIPNSKIDVSGKSYQLLNSSKTQFLIDIYELKKKYLFIKNRIKVNCRFINTNCNLFYCIFINNIYENLFWLENYKIPFAFTLYPGGGFQVNNSLSDHKLKKVLSSPQFRKVIVTQLFTKEYLIKNNFCTADKIIYIFGCVVPQESLKKQIDLKEYYPKKETFDIIFCAAKYMPKGLDKGYDVFIELAHNLIKKYDFIRFHVVGGFNKDDIDVSQLNNKITFHGYQKFEDLADIYQKMDIILSPNKPFLYDKGAFDGFPLGTVIEAVFNGVVALVTDNLNQNTVFENGKEIIIIDNNIESIQNEIVNLIQNPDKLKIISKYGREKFLEIYSNDFQMNPRIELLRNEITSKYD